MHKRTNCPIYEIIAYKKPFFILILPFCVDTKVFFLFILHFCAYTKGQIVRFMKLLHTQKGSKTPFYIFLYIISFFIRIKREVMPQKRRLCLKERGDASKKEAMPPSCSRYRNGEVLFFY